MMKICEKRQPAVRSEEKNFFFFLLSLDGFNQWEKRMSIVVASEQDLFLFNCFSKILLHNHHRKCHEIQRIDFIIKVNLHRLARE